MTVLTPSPATRLAGRLCSFIGWLSVIVGFLMSIGARQGDNLRGSTRAVLFLVSMAVMPTGVYLIRLGRRVRRVPLAAQDLNTLSDFVVYLRPFEADKTALKQRSEAIFSPLALSSEEEDIVWALKHIGRVVAAGDPRDAGPSLGADRTYLPESHWQTRVLSLIQSATLVVLRVGRGQGFQWELETTLRLRALRDVVFLLPKDMAALDSLTRELARRRVEMPPYKPGSRWHSADTTIGGLLWFDARHTPHIEVIAPRVLENTLKRAFLRSLKPMAQQNSRSLGYG